MSLPDDFHLSVSNSALLCMDFQHDIIGPSALAPTEPEPRARIEAAVSRTGELLDAVRRCGMFVVHVRVAYRAGYPDANRFSPMAAYMQKHECLLDGSHGAEIDSRVAPVEGEPVVTKRGVGSFTGTDLDQLLRRRGIEQVLLSGLVTHYVVAGTAREAHDRGYGFVVLEDCCASETQERHDAALKDLAFLGAIGSAEDVENRLGCLEG